VPPYNLRIVEVPVRTLDFITRRSPTAKSSQASALHNFHLPRYTALVFDLYAVEGQTMFAGLPIAIFAFFPLQYHNRGFVVVFAVAAFPFLHRLFFERCVVRWSCCNRGGSVS
jgi:hypothetical protein